MAIIEQRPAPPSDPAKVSRFAATRTAARGRVRRPTRSSLELAAKAAVATSLAIWLGNRIGLRDTYWAGVSAVVATAGTLGASMGAAVSRISATVVGLAIGLAAFAMPVSGVIVAGATVFVALTVLPALSLDAGARLGAGSTLIITALPGQSAVGDALARGANVPLGCAVAVAVGLAVLPHRAAKGLRARLGADIAQAGELLRSAMSTYLGSCRVGDLPQRARRLRDASSAHAAALRDAAREPGVRGERLGRLQRDVDALRGLVEQADALVRIAADSGEDASHSLVGDELEAAADGIAGAARALSPSSANGERERALQRSREALARLDGAFAGVRDRRATVGYSTDDVARLLSVIRCVHAAGAAVFELTG